MSNTRIPKEELVFDHEENTTLTFPNNYEAKIKVSREIDYSSESIVGKTFKLYKGNVFLKNIIVSSQGYIEFTDELNAGTYSYKLTFDGNNQTNSVEHEWEVNITKGEVDFTCINNTSSVVIGQSNIIQVRLRDAKGNPIKNYNLSIDVMYSTGEETNYSSTTNNSGVATFQIQYPSGYSDPIYAYTTGCWFDSDSNHVSKELNSIPFVWVLANSPILTIQAPDTTYAQSPVIEGTLKDKTTGNPISECVVKLYIDGEYTSENTTDENGKVNFVNPSTPKSHSSTFTYVLEFEGDGTHNATMVAKEAGYFKNQTRLSEQSNTHQCYIHQTNTVTVKLMNNEGAVLRNSRVRYTWVNTDDDGNVTTDTGTITTDNNGVATLNLTENLQSKTVIEWSYPGNARYEAVYLSTVCSWVKQPTRMVVISNSGHKEVMYQGKVTIKLVDVNNNPIVGASVYKTLDFETTEGEPVTLERYMPKTTLIGEEGESTIQYTPTNQGDIFGTFTWVFDGGNEYKDSYFTTTLLWSKKETHMIMSFNSGDKKVTQQGKITITLLDNQDNPLVGVPVYKTLDFETTEGEPVTLERYVPKTTLTGEEGESTIQYTPTNQGNIRGTFTWLYGGDNIYGSSSYAWSIVWSNLTTLLEISTDKEVYTDCYPASITYTLTDELGRGISGDIYTNYDNGTYKNQKWIPTTPEYVSTDSNGIATQTLKAYGGIRLIQAVFNGSSIYGSSVATTHVEYDLTKTYTGTVNDGVVEFPVQCALTMAKGLPDGLYDVEIEYIPPEAETGACELYGAATKKEPLRKKTGVKLTCLTNELEKPVYEPLFLTIEARNYVDDILRGYEITSYINNGFRSRPNHITNNNGRISRGFASIVVGSVNRYKFVFNQTRDYSGCVLEIDTTTLKRKPTLELPSQISGYTNVPTEMKATHYFSHDTCNRYGEVVKIDSEGNYVFHNPLAAVSDEYFEYYYVEDDVEIECTKSYYDEADTFSSKLFIPNKKIEWKNNNKSKLLTSALTNSRGESTATYNSLTAYNNTVYAISEEDENYHSCEEETQLNIALRNETWFGDINYDEKDDNDNYIRYTVYHHQFPLFAYFYIDSNKRTKEGEEIIFKQGNVVLGKGTVDNTGRAVLSVKINKPTLYPYTVEYKGHDQFTDSTKSYQVHVLKQTPLISLSINNNNPTFGDKITLQATFTESNAADNYPLKSTGLLFKDGDEHILWERTNENGVATISYVLKHAGQRVFYVGFEDENNTKYNTVSATQTITVNKMPTHFESNDGNNVEIYGLTSKDLILTLKDSNNTVLLDKTVSINYNDTTTTTKTNSYGQITLKTGRYDIGTEKDVVFTFGGDSNYNSSTYNMHLVWGDYLNDEQCDDLEKFDIIIEQWYGSDGTSKFGLDVDNLNKRDCNRNIIYECDCSPVNDGEFANILLRNYCNDFKTEGGYEQTSSYKAVYAPTGVILRNKHIVSSANCVISFDLCFGYDGSNNEIDSVQYGGHFGLMNSGDDVTTAENSPVRFEIYRNNAYAIQEGGTAVGSSMAYTFSPNTWYSVEFDINNSTVKMTIFDKDGTTKGYKTYTSNRTYEGLSPYVFAFTNGTKVILRRLKVTRR